MFNNKTNKRISLNPIDKSQYDGDTTPIMTDYIPSTTPTSATFPSSPRQQDHGSGRGGYQQAHRGNGGASGGRGYDNGLKSAPIQLPSGDYGDNHSNRSQHGQGYSNGGNGARRNNTYHSSSPNHQQLRHHATHRSNNSSHSGNGGGNGNGRRYRNQQPMPTQQMTYPSSRSQSDLHNGYQSSQPIYSPTASSFHSQYSSSPGSPLPPYIERPTMNPPPPSYSPSTRDGKGGRMPPSRSTSDPELALYESSAYYTDRNRMQQQQKQMMQQRRKQQQEAQDKECCSCCRDMGEFCPCFCFCCMFGAAAA
ncbi:hypothetical protein BX616_005970 [Lobosporangium transversale]|uniref:Uncharacterized protein n=1 Tax=Lobosporangium transversale TaxID=64571 RepID=A0A1Y2G7T7_9FUNG|nr:hypothetical protein BCR41DRAFT_363504 [Lobosporangium transversale]KAF9897226.1 hypothetical protein BX616_005970 [Lobosporangium transversale]ORZ01861.1 hypothetical protein BCR41DRAFT_363504 [Lobosporangium transversale]|eukprot:XP_021876158.1 hypothetical protein BCR41DRAFT_363504 [Lobosporangium transversale]